MATAANRRLTMQKAAKRARVTERTLRNWIVVGLGKSRVRLRAEKFGSKWLIDPADLDDFNRRLTEAALKAGAGR